MDILQRLLQLNNSPLFVKRSVKALSDLIHACLVRLKRLPVVLQHCFSVVRHSYFIVLAVSHAVWNIEEQYFKDSTYSNSPVDTGPVGNNNNNTFDALLCGMSTSIHVQVKICGFVSQDCCDFVRCQPVLAQVLTHRRLIDRINSRHKDRFVTGAKHCRLGQVRIRFLACNLNWAMEFFLWHCSNMCVTVNKLIPLECFFITANLHISQIPHSQCVWTYTNTCSSPGKCSNWAQKSAARYTAVSFRVFRPQRRKFICDVWVCASTQLVAVCCTTIEQFTPHMGGLPKKQKSCQSRVHTHQFIQRSQTPRFYSQAISLCNEIPQYADEISNKLSGHTLTTDQPHS